MTYKILTGHVIDWLTELDTQSVQCVVTSPPYYGLRNYQTEPQVWDGKPGCDHQWIENRWFRAGGGQANGSGEAFSLSGPDNAARLKKARWYQDATCQKCGAWRGNLGSEPTIGLYVKHLVSVFREVRQVLRNDGVVWLNIGDSYQNKQLLMVPAHLALALQNDGWVLRCDVIWNKTNGMPDPTINRPTRHHEYIFMLSKNEHYFYDANAIMEPAAEPERIRNDRIAGKNGHTVRHSLGGMMTGSKTRNARSVWTINTYAFPAAHFATFPPELPRRCILAGSRPGDTILDPFSGAGTTLMVADRLGRDGIGIELNPEYVALSEQRIESDRSARYTWFDAGDD